MKAAAGHAGAEFSGNPIIFRTLIRDAGLDGMQAIALEGCRSRGVKMALRCCRWIQIRRSRCPSATMRQWCRAPWPTCSVPSCTHPPAASAASGALAFHMAWVCLKRVLRPGGALQCLLTLQQMISLTHWPCPCWQRRSYSLQHACFAHVLHSVSPGLYILSTCESHTPTLLRCLYRVHTLAMAVVEDAASLFRAADGGATLALLAKLTVENAQQCKMEEARNKMQVRGPFWLARILLHL